MPWKSSLLSGGEGVHRRKKEVSYMEAGLPGASPNLSREVIMARDGCQ